MKILYTGSFNPFHSGHQYVFDVACKCFGKENVWIGIGVNPEKEKTDCLMLKNSVYPITRNVISYMGLTSEVVKEKGFDLLIRGIRPGHNLDDENDLLYWNRKLCGVETILIPTPPELNQVSSSAIRILHKNNQDVSSLMNPFVFKRWTNQKLPYTVYFGNCCCGKTTFLKNFNAREFDKIVWDYYLGIENPDNYKGHLRQAFYDKNDKAFNALIYHLSRKIDWYGLFGKEGNIDFPNIGSYWNYIPQQILQNCKFVKIQTTMANRQYFAQCRGVNPKLIETSDYFYKDPEFWDEEIDVKRTYLTLLTNPD